MAHNGYTDFEMENHEDGSHTFDLKHEDHTKNLRCAVADLDSIHDKLEDFLHEEEEEHEMEEHPEDEK